MCREINRHRLESLEHMTIRRFGENLNPIERRFLEMLHHQIAGLRDKIDRDLGMTPYENELANLSNDPVYNKFSLACPEYVAIRLIGRISISIGRRLGEIYDKMPRYVASTRFSIPEEIIAEEFNGLKLDIGLRYEYLEEVDRRHLASILMNYSAKGFESGVAIEIRYNFNPNDSARLRKDELMARYVCEAGLFPLYLVYSTSSPREDAIARLRRSGWLFLEGENATRFSTDLFGVDFLRILDRPEIYGSVQRDMQELMQKVFSSHALGQIFGRGRFL